MHAVPKMSEVGEWFETRASPPQARTLPDDDIADIFASRSAQTLNYRLRISSGVSRMKFWPGAKA